MAVAKAVVVAAVALVAGVRAAVVAVVVVLVPTVAASADLSSWQGVQRGPAHRNLPLGYGVGRKARATGMSETKHWCVKPLSHKHSHHVWSCCSLALQSMCRALRSCQSCSWARSLAVWHQRTAQHH